MKIASEDLLKRLSKGLAPLYVIHGDAHLLAIEAADAIRAAARSSGYTEREVLIADTGFKWDELANCTRSLSLFSDRKLVDLRIPSGKPGVEGAQALQEYCANLSNEIITLVTMPRADKATQNSKWFAAFEKAGIVVSAEDIPRNALPAWIAGRFKRQNQSTDADTLNFIADRVEGNLLAAWQEIQKLALLYPEGNLSFEQVKDAVMDVARYDVFKLSEAMLAGDMARFSRILDGLRAEGAAAQLILWTLAEDIRTVNRVLRAVRQSSNMSNALRDARVWGVRQKLVEQAVRRFSPKLVDRALRQAAFVDKVVKGLRRGDAWDELLQLGIRCAKTRPA